MDKITSKYITWFLANKSKWKPRQWLMIPNLSWSFLEWEADLICVSKSGYITEIEIKISKADLLKDQEKYKFQNRQLKSWEYIKEFYYCVPEKLLPDIPESYKQFAGIIVVPSDGRCRCRIIHLAPVNKKAKKITDVERMNLMRILGLRFWSQYKINK